MEKLELKYLNNTFEDLEEDERFEVNGGGPVASAISIVGSSVSISITVVNNPIPVRPGSPSSHGCVGAVRP